MISKKFSMFNRQLNQISTRFPGWIILMIDEAAFPGRIVCKAKPSDIMVEFCLRFREDRKAYSIRNHQGNNVICFGLKHDIRFKAGMLEAWVNNLAEG